MDSKQLAERIKGILEDKKATDVEIIEVAQKTIIAEQFVIATGTSTTQIKALAEEVNYVLKKEDDLTPDHIEGVSTARWILLDYRDVIVHIFHPEERENYSLEKLWASRPSSEDIINEES